MNSVSEIIEQFDQEGYVADEELATILFLMMKLEKPVLLEGNPGVGKTEVANLLAGCLNTDLIRLQCYEGLDVHSAVYEWNYQKQLLSIKIEENRGRSGEELENHIFGQDFLLKRPLLRAITAEAGPPVLLIDEIDRADEEFEAFLLELLSAFQISIPELGTIRATHRPLVVLTSNRTRELGDALKRRCLYHWIDYPDHDKEVRIVQKHLPDIDRSIAGELVGFVQAVRQQKLSKTPGIAETVDWVKALLALEYQGLSTEGIAKSLGCLLKSNEDLDLVKSHGLDKFTAED